MGNVCPEDHCIRTFMLGKKEWQWRWFYWKPTLRRRLYHKPEEQMEQLKCCAAQGWWFESHGQTTEFISSGRFFLTIPSDNYGIFCSCVNWVENLRSSIGEIVKSETVCNFSDQNFDLWANVWRIQCLKWNYQWGCIIARWHYWSRMLVCCVFNKSKTNLLEENDAFFIRDKYSHLAVYLHVIQPHCIWILQLDLTVLLSLQYKLPKYFSRKTTCQAISITINRVDPLSCNEWLCRSSDLSSSFETFQRCRRRIFFLCRVSTICADPLLNQPRNFWDWGQGQRDLLVLTSLVSGLRPISLKFRFL